MLRSDKGEPHGVGADWWAFGTLIYEIMTGDAPFGEVGDGTSKTEVFLRISQGSINWPWGLSSEAKDLIKHCLDPNVKTRYTEAQVLAPHAWFKGISLADAMEGNLLPPYIPDVTEEGNASEFITWGDLEYEDRRKPKDPDYCDLSTHGLAL